MKDIDIRDHAVIIKYDRGHEEVDTDTQDLGENTEKELIRLVVERDRDGRIVKVKVQNL